MPGFDVVPPEVGNLAVGFRHMGDGMGRAAGQLDQLLQAAESAVSNAVMATALYEYRARWRLAVTRLGTSLTDTAAALTGSADAYTRTDEGIARSETRRGG